MGRVCWSIERRDGAIGRGSDDAALAQVAERGLIQVEQPAVDLGVVMAEHRPAIEHRLFCHITQNWRGKPLIDRVAIVELICATTTKTGLKVECGLDERTYEKGIKVSDAEMAGLDITGDTFHPEWNYTIKPRRQQKE